MRDKVIVLLTLMVCPGFVICHGEGSSQVRAGETERARIRPIQGHITLDPTGLDLSAILAEVSRQLGRGIIAEGEPIEGAKLPRLDGQLEKVLDEVADAYDYSWKLSQSGVILMSKRFRNPDSFPAIGPEELILMLKGVVSALGALPYDRSVFAFPAQLTAFYHSLTANQKAVLLRGDRLYYRDLQPEQAALLGSGILSGTYGSLRRLWDTALDYAEGIRSSSVYLSPSGPTEAEPDLSLGSPADDRGLIRFECAFSSRRSKSEYQLPMLLLRAPKRAVSISSQRADSVGRLSEGAKAADSGTMTVGALIERISTQSEKRIIVESGLETRRIIAHTADLGPSFLEAVAELFDWQLFQQGNATFRLSRKRVRMPRTSAEVPRAIQASLTPDFRRFLGIGIPLHDLPVSADPSLRDRIERLMQDRKDPFVQRNVVTALTPWRLETIAKRMRLSLLAELEDALFAGIRIDYKTLTDDQKRRLVIGVTFSLLSSTNTHFNVFNDQLPDYHKDMSLLQIELRGSGLGYGCETVVNGVPMFLGGGAQINLSENKLLLERAPKPIN